MSSDDKLMMLHQRQERTCSVQRLQRSSSGGRLASCGGRGRALACQLLHLDADAPHVFDGYREVGVELEAFSVYKRRVVGEVGERDGTAQVVHDSMAEQLPRLRRVLSPLLQLRIDKRE
jgi:hypothetical protein